MAIKHLLTAGIANAHPSEPPAIRFLITRGLGVGSISPGGYTPFATFAFFDQKEAKRRERQEEQRLREEAQLLEEIQEMLGPSQELINNIWTVALLQIDEEPGQVIEVEHDIDNRSLLRLTKKILTLGVIDSEKVMTSTIASPNSRVTFMQTENGWLFFRTKGSA